ncbi:hypothetical protein [Alloactinosynnema sp. L-07]|uniref:hypothetical protein n=1 Tax=Alloactinosynnema sp. L-07 TaxID=1653480 RepID=UPI0012FCBF96|nr:hypothetical protein [Alloactinosynnema sp. L-07]
MNAIRLLSFIAMSVMSMAPSASATQAEAAPPAAAGPHGTVANKLKTPVKITRSWCHSTNGPCANKDIVTLKAGGTSKGDIDGFHVPSGQRYYVEFDKLIGKEKRCVGSGWHKINDTIVARILRTC